MKIEEIIAAMNGFLHTATTTLANWLEKRLPLLSKNWLEDCVLRVLDQAQLDRLSDVDKSLLKLDLASLLTITDRNWFSLREQYRFNAQDRRALTALRSVRNRWAHCGSSLPPKESVEQDLETVYAFFECLGENRLLGKIRKIQEKVRQTDFEIAEEKAVSPAAPPARRSMPAEIREGDLVHLAGDTSKMGAVMSVKPTTDGTLVYTVFIDNSPKTYYDGQIIRAEAAGETERDQVSIQELRNRLTAFQVRNPSASSLYSLNSARIEFVPYQFRPALKIIKSDQPRLLVADSVGVGKTIEAGLIMKELQVRSGAESVLIICPKPLVAERKWELEMRRFDEDFTQMDGETLRRAISDMDRDGVWPDRHSKTIIPYSLLQGNILKGASAKKKRGSIGLLDLDPAPHFDLVIIDEAHHVRNRNTQAYEGVDFFCRNAGAVVMLTATPVQTSDDNLYTLLNLLRPDVVTDQGTFQLMSRPNRFINQAVHTVRRAAGDWQEEAHRLLEEAGRTQWGSHVIRGNPQYIAALRALEQPQISREERVRLISDIEGLHSFSRMINRTRRQDIQDFCTRHPYTLNVPFTDAQRELHDGLLTFEAQTLARLHGNQNVAFMMGTIRRQAASCIFGLAPFLNSILNKRLCQILDEPDFDMEDGEFENERTICALRELSKELLDLAKTLPEADPKFDEMLDVILQKQSNENNKIIIFSTFRHTLAYLKRKLETQGLRVAQIDGSVKDDERVSLRERFQMEKSSPEAIDILLFTEVGCEGLDYQFCDMMINYDLPWNPMRIEQRIGRIDRRGQKSETVSIYNMITEGTIDADIYDRCLTRIGVFESSIGECAEILGALTKSIQDISLNARLTDDERREKLELLADNEVRRIQELRRLEQEEKQLFGFDLSVFTMNQEVQNAENPWITQDALQFLVESYLDSALGGKNAIQGEKPLKNLRLSGDSRQKLLHDYRALLLPRTKQNRRWEQYLKGGNPSCNVTFDGECADQNRSAMFIAVGHPLVMQAAAFFSTSKSIYLAAMSSCMDVPAGQYPFEIYAWDYQGYRPQHKLVAICENLTLQGQLLELLWTAEDADIPEPDQGVWDKLEGVHRQLWAKSREEHKDAAAADLTFKQESLQYNFENQKRTLEGRLAEATDERIRRMYTSQLSTSESNYNEKLRELTLAVKQSDIYTELMVKGMLVIE